MNSPDEKRFQFLISEANKIGNFKKALDLLTAFKIYKISKHYNIHDWQKIRTIQFWQASDKLPENEKQNFLLKTLEKYAENKKRLKTLFNEK